MFANNFLKVSNHMFITMQIVFLNLNTLRLTVYFIDFCLDEVYKLSED